MLILGIESTCDETGVALVENGRIVHKSLVSSSVDFHINYGGIVPEIAAREQIKTLIPLLSKAGINRNVIDAIAVSKGPGLIGSLLIGVESAKALAYIWNKKLIGVNHLVGHIYSSWLLKRTPDFPLVALVVSGGHTDLVYMENHGNIKWLGGTRDDAAGEVFDKVARVLGMPYPGGPEIEKASLQFSSKDTYTFSSPMINDKSFDFSFSGLKTQVINKVAEIQFLKDEDKFAIAKSFQNAIVKVLVSKTIKAANKYNAKSIIVCGGVSANEQLRNTMNSIDYIGNVFFPIKKFSVDNGAMIAATAYYNFKLTEPNRLLANSSLHF